eukprot:55737_1
MRMHGYYNVYDIQHLQEPVLIPPHRLANSPTQPSKSPSEMPTYQSSGPTNTPTDPPVNAPSVTISPASNPVITSTDDVTIAPSNDTMKQSEGSDNTVLIVLAVIGILFGVGACFMMGIMYGRKHNGNAVVTQVELGEENQNEQDQTTQGLVGDGIETQAVVYK